MTALDGLRKRNEPVLALYDELDLQVPLASNVRRANGTRRPRSHLSLDRGFDD
jgi:hypothetical protein